MHPDFVFFHEVRGKIAASILDPHGHHLDDALTKLKALAKFAEEFGEDFHRIEALAEVDGHMKVIDMNIGAAREEVRFRCQSAVDAYRSSIAVDYDLSAAGADAKVVVPFRRVTPKPSERYKTCVPLVELAAAAGAWSETQEGIRELGDADEWVTWDGDTPFGKDMFVARVLGRSMEPTIPDGAYCLFRLAELPSSPERPVLVRHAGISNPETGGQFTVKLYRESKGPQGEKRLVLQPANPEYEAVEITLAGADDVRVIAEVVEVVGR